MKLAGQCAIISGASQGLGFAIAQLFVEEGAHVMICARNSEELNEASNRLNKIAEGRSKVFAMPVDVSKINDVNLMVNATLKEIGQIDILVANAAVHGPKGALDIINWEEWSEAIDINLKGTVIQCREILSHFKKNRKGKIIILSGGGATKPMPFLSAYAASKAAVVRFAETLAEEVREFNIDVNAVAPGALNTRLLDDILSAGPGQVGEVYYEQALKQHQQGGSSLEVAASLCSFLASKLSDGITGKLLSAVWDPWRNLPEFLDDLQKTDIYTLRRILPNDRGKTWGDAS